MVNALGNLSECTEDVRETHTVGSTPTLSTEIYSHYYRDE